MNRPCVICGSPIARNAKSYCGYRCAAIGCALNAQIELKCQGCGRLFKLKRCESKRRFCSTQCVYAFRRGSEEWGAWAANGGLNLKAHIAKRRHAAELKANEFGPAIAAEYAKGFGCKITARNLGLPLHTVITISRALGLNGTIKIGGKNKKPIPPPDVLIIQEYAKDIKVWEAMERKWLSHPAVKCWMNHWCDKSKNAERARKRWHKRKTDPHFRIRQALRHRLWKFTTSRGLIRAGKTMELLGCDWETFRSHIESRFQDGMQWSNYGRWEMDHIIPCTAFDLTASEDQKRCFHYSNLQPLWEADNIRKGNNYVQNSRPAPGA